MCGWQGCSAGLARLDGMDWPNAARASDAKGRQDMNGRPPRNPELQRLRFPRHFLADIPTQSWYPSLSLWPGSRANSPVMIDQEKATALAFNFVHERYQSIDASAIMFDKDTIVETNFAWVLQWDDRRYLEGGDPRFCRTGQHPVVVLKSDGAAFRLPTLTQDEIKRLDSGGPFGSIQDRLSKLMTELGRGT